MNGSIAIPYGVENRMRVAPRRTAASERLRSLGMLLAWTCLCLSSSARAVQVNHILGNLYTATQAGPTTISINGSTIPGAIPGTTTSHPLPSSGGWSFSESGMNAPNNGFRNNRHEFYFSEDGVNPIALNGDVPWDVSFDVSVTGTFLSPRKTFGFSVFDTGGGADSLINLTTNAPVDGNGDGPTPGESAMFSGNFRFLRLIGVTQPGGFTSQNPTVGYVAGSTVRMRIIHTPSVTPEAGSMIEYSYNDGTLYSTGPQTLRIGPGNDAPGGVFNNGIRLGFLIQGIAHLSQPNDSYAINVSNFQATIGAQPTADFNSDGVVDGADFLIWQRGLGLATGATRAQGNTNPFEDGDVDAEDLALWKTSFGAAAATANLGGVPEPATLPVACVGAAAAWIGRIRRRRRSASAYEVD